MEESLSHTYDTGTSGCQVWFEAPLYLFILSAENFAFEILRRGIAATSGFSKEFLGDAQTFNCLSCGGFFVVDFQHGYAASTGFVIQVLPKVIGYLDLSSTTMSIFQNPGDNYLSVWGAMVAWRFARNHIVGSVAVQSASRLRWFVVPVQTSIPTPGTFDL